MKPSKLFVCDVKTEIYASNLVLVVGNIAQYFG